jgi:LGFP repeat
MTMPCHGIKYHYFEILFCLIIVLIGVSVLEYRAHGLTAKEIATNAMQAKYEELVNKGFPALPTPGIVEPLATKNNDGYYQFFRGYGIWWSQQTGAHEVHGAILNKWRELNFEYGGIGYPTTDERRVPYTENQKYSQFQNGYLVTSPSGIYSTSTLLETDVVVKFKSINIYDDKDGFGEGDGEYILRMIANGKSIQLLTGGEDLGDDSYFPFTSKEIHLKLPRYGILHILSDGCESDIDESLGCLEGDDEIATIDRPYSGPTYGYGPHAESPGDYKLSFYICNSSVKDDNPNC